MTTETEQGLLAIHRIITGHGPSEVCGDCPQPATDLMLFGQGFTDTCPVCHHRHSPSGEACSQCQEGGA